MDGAGGAAGGLSLATTTFPATTFGASVITNASSAATCSTITTTTAATTSITATPPTGGGVTGGGFVSAPIISATIPASSYPSPWGSTNLTSKPEECSSSTEREARSVALEKAYVHDVYQQIACHFSDSRYRAWPRVKQFLLDLDPGSLVCDVGCGNGKYLSINPSIYKIGLDRCSNLANIAREKDHEVMISDCLALPFRDECFDAGLSIAVIHHFATTERRVAALKELARVLRIGGRLMVSVWAMEQRHRKFESQDVLVPWNRPMTSSSDDKTSSIERDLNSTTTTTSDDDATHYHAYTQTSDSDSFPSMHGVCRKRGRVRHHRGRSIDPTCLSSSQSSSDLSSPNESCYSFVRRALQKLAGTRRNRGGRRPWFLQGLDIAAGTDEIVGAADQFAYMDCGEEIGVDFQPNPHHQRTNDRVNSGGCALGGAGASLSLAENLIPIELRQLESAEYAELFQQSTQHQTSSSSTQSATSKAALLFSNVLYPRRRRTLETTCGDLGHSSEAQAIGAQPKSKSLSDLLGLLPVSLLRSAAPPAQHYRKGAGGNESGEGHKKRGYHRSPVTSGSEGMSNADEGGNSSSVSPLVQSYEDPRLGPFRRHVSVQTEYYEESFEMSPSSTSFNLMHPQQKPGAGDSTAKRRQRPMLVKQKHSICSDPEKEEEAENKSGEPDGSKAAIVQDSTVDNGMTLNIPNLGGCSEESAESEDHFDTNEKRSPRESGVSPKKISPRESDCPTQQSNVNKKLKHQKNSIMPPSSMPFWKQTSMNDELIFSSERVKEKERLKKQVQKQCSLNEELIYSKGKKGTRPVENNRWDQMKEAFLKNSSNVKCFQLLKNGLSRGFRAGANGGCDVATQNLGNSNTSSTTGGSSSGDTGQPLPDGGGTAAGGSSGSDANTPDSVERVNGEHGERLGGGANGADLFYGQQSSQNKASARSQGSGTSGGSSGGTTSLRNGIVRMLQNWKQSEDGAAYPSGSPGGHRLSGAVNSGASTSARRALFPPFFLRRSSAGSLTLVGKQGNKQDHHHLNHHGQCSSPGPLSPLGKSVVVEGGELNGSANGGSAAGNKLLPGVRHVRKLSREDGSDSSKDSSFQSDTSVDSEDSFASVIFIPKSGGMDDFGGDFCGTRANSTDSDRSPKSPASRLSPPTHGNLPKSPSPLAQEVQAIMRRRSPEMSPVEPGRHLRLTPGGSNTSSGFGSSGGASASGEGTKFLFDESATTRLLAADDSSSTDLTQSVSQQSSVVTVSSPLKESTIFQDPPMVAVSMDQVSQVVILEHTEREDGGAMAVLPRPVSPPADAVITITATKSSGKRRVEKIEVLRKPGVVPEGRSGYTRQLVRRSLPKALAVELFNPETDDADTSDTSSSSPNSVSSVVSVVNEDSSAGVGGTTSGGVLDEAKQPIITEEEVDEMDEAEELENDDMMAERGGEEPSLIGNEDRAHPSQKLSSTNTVSKLGSTSDWLSSLDTSASLPSNSGVGHQYSSGETVSTSASTSKQPAPLKLPKKYGEHKSVSEEHPLPPVPGHLETNPEPPAYPSSAEPCTGNPPCGSDGGALSVEMLEERDSLFDSMENLTNNSSNSRQYPSRNPSIDSSVRMSSTCSCSIRGGDSFDSWTSAKSSLTNSSCTHPPLAPLHKTSLASMITLPLSTGQTSVATGSTVTGCLGGSLPTSGGAYALSGTPPLKMSSLDSNGTNSKGFVGTGGAVGGGGGSATTSATGRRRDAQSRIRVQSSSKSSSAAGDDTEDSTALTCHRYYHVFREGELDKLIEKYVQNLHIISSYYDHANWCIVAEKVQVWTI